MVGLGFRVQVLGFRFRWVCLLRPVSVWELVKLRVNSVFPAFSLGVSV